MTVKLLTRRTFLQTGAAVLTALAPIQTRRKSIMTINGLVPSTALGKTLVHEHFLVDFIGADKTTADRWNREDVIERILPLLEEVKRFGVKTMFDCTPAFLGRDVTLLTMLARRSGLTIITNTGLYGAVQNKYLPPYAFTETAEELATRWIREYNIGIDGTGIKPGFIKIGVDGPTLSEMHKKLIKAAALTHLQTGLTICSHTGKAAPAFEQLEILKSNGVAPQAFVWVHAQNEDNIELHLKAANMGCWVSLDGIGWGEANRYSNIIGRLKNEGFLNRVLISHDLGWYKPGEVNGGEIKGYTKMFTDLLPLLEEQGITFKDVKQLLVINPANAFAIHGRKI